MKTKKIYVEYSQLKSFAESIMKGEGIPQKHANIVANCLLFANLRGIDSHGIIRLPYYIKRLRQKGTNSHPKVKTLNDYQGTVLLDGDNGLGQVIGILASELAIKKAKEFGISFIIVKNSSHFGAASFYSNHIAEHNMVGIAISNTTPVMTTWGGVQRIIGNNPLSIALPYKEDIPVILDMAMSKVAGGKVRYFAKNKKNIPKGWIVNSWGKETTHPEDLAQGGSLLPFGEHKGFALAIMMELLTGALSGGELLSQVNSWLKKPDVATHMSQSYIAIDIKRLIDLEIYYRQINLLIQEIKSSKVLPGFGETFFPGEIESNIIKTRKKEGIPLTSEILDDLKKLSITYQVEIPNLNLNK